MTEPLSRKPRFKTGDRVLVVTHGDVRGRAGSIADVVSAPIDAVYRYRVRFDDGTTGVFFGFELERITDSEAANY